MLTYLWYVKFNIFFLLLNGYMYCHFILIPLQHVIPVSITEMFFPQDSIRKTIIAGDQGVMQAWRT